MKKAFMLVAAVAMLAAPVFAEITVSGDVEFYTEYELSENTADEMYDYDTENALILDLGISISDYTSLSVEIEGNPEEGDTNPAVAINDWVLTQDVTGALGLDMPVTFTANMGDQSFGPEMYTDEWDDLAETDLEDNFGNSVGADLGGSDIDFVLDFGIMEMATISLYVSPLTLADNTASETQMGINVYGVFGPASLSFYYAANDGAKDFGVNGLISLAPVAVGFQAQFYDLEKEDMEDAQTYVYATYTSDFGLEATLEYFGYNLLGNQYDTDMDLAADAAYTMEVAEGMTADVDFGASNLLEANNSELTFNAGVGVSYAMSEVVELHANFDVNNITDEPAENLELNIGSNLAIDTVSYSIDYTMDTDGIVGENDLVGGDTAHMISLLVSTSF